MQPPSNSSIHGLTLKLVPLANHSHHSVVFSRSSSLVVTDSSTNTLLPLQLLLATLLHWMHRATQSAPTLCPSLLHAAEDSRESSWHAYLQRIARTLHASIPSMDRSRNSAQRLLEIAMHVVVTDQHCQQQTSSCIDIASLDSCTTIVKSENMLHRCQAQLLTTPTIDKENANID